jgi:hypothetical protein
MRVCACVCVFTYFCRFVCAFAILLVLNNLVEATPLLCQFSVDSGVLLKWTKGFTTSGACVCVRQLCNTALLDTPQHLQ